MTAIQFYPNLNVILAITNSYPAVLTLFLPVNYAVNEFLSIRCPNLFGMTQIDKLTGKVLSINTVANTVTMDIDTRGFDPFVFGGIAQLAQTIPAGELGTLDAAVRDNTLRPGYIPV